MSTCSGVEGDVEGLWELESSVGGHRVDAVECGQPGLDGVLPVVLAVARPGDRDGPREEQGRDGPPANLIPACMTPSMTSRTLPPPRTSCVDVAPCGSRFAPRRGDAAHYDSYAQVAERQTRCLQVAVSLRAWGFKSPLAHSRLVNESAGKDGRNSRSGHPAGSFCVWCRADVAPALGQDAVGSRRTPSSGLQGR